MLSFAEFSEINESKDFKNVPVFDSVNDMELNKVRVAYVKGYKPSLTGVNLKYKGDVIGWFSNKYNLSGWVVVELNDFDKKWVKESKGPSSEIYRTFTPQGNTSIVKITAKGMYAFIDDDHLMKTDEIKFERMAPLRKMILVVK